MDEPLQDTSTILLPYLLLPTLLLAASSVVQHAALYKVFQKVCVKLHEHTMLNECGEKVLINGTIYKWLEVICPLHVEQELRHTIVVQRIAENVSNKLSNNFVMRANLNFSDYKVITTKSLEYHGFQKALGSSDNKEDNLKRLFNQGTLLSWLIQPPKSLYQKYVEYYAFGLFTRIKYSPKLNKKKKKERKKERLPQFSHNLNLQVRNKQTSEQWTNDGLHLFVSLINYSKASFCKIMDHLELFAPSKSIISINPNIRL
ncbi:hypothetical protein WN51_01831 [Melipona quadrifasciata]|uniref:Uncharacterized protein n=1 Tax=Melipona quadrifasciata TaxID=166423 RepID=A0A0N0BEZ5_9HYME|nr:hypothetical protein WN51_01831 [Melipona quadrifasciata]